MVIQAVPVGAAFFLCGLDALCPELRFCGKVDGCQLGLPSARISAMTIGPAEKPPSPALPVNARK